MSDWRTCTWGDLVELNYGKALRDYQGQSGRYRVYGTNGAVGWTDEPLAQGPGVILGRKGAYRGVEYSPDPFYVIDTAYFITPREELDMRWLYYAVIFHRLGEIDDGSPIPSTTRSAVYARTLRVPSLEEQASIANAVGAFDDKIAADQHLSSVLESIATALFRAWFVDFEPVKAKADGVGESPLMPSDVFEQLPDSFTDSPVGPIPTGWRTAKLSEIFQVNPSRSLSKGVTAPYLEMKNMPEHGHAPEAVAHRDFSSGRKFTNGDTLVARITPCLENGKTAFVDFLEEDEVGWGSTEYIALRSNEPFPLHYAYLLARTDHFRDFAIKSMTGTSGRQRVPFSALDHYEMVVPPDYLLSCFRPIVEALFDRSRSAHTEIEQVRVLRNLLLDELLSGRMRARQDAV